MKGRGTPNKSEGLEDFKKKNKEGGRLLGTQEYIFILKYTDTFTFT